MGKRLVIGYLHTHWDREWYRQKEEYNIRLTEVIDDVLSKLECGEIPCFYFDGQTSALIDYLKYCPEKFDLIKKLIEEKKFFIGPFFVSADAFLSNIRCFAKNLELGIEYSKKLGCDDFIGYLSDIFGHTRACFEVLNHFDIKKTIIWRGVNNDKCDLNVAKTSTLWLAQGYYNDFFHQDVDIETQVKSVEDYLDKIAKYSGETLLLPIGGDHLAIPKNIGEKIEKFNQISQKYFIELSCPQKYFEHAKFANDSEFDGEFLQNSANFVLSSVWSSRIYQKIKNAKLSHRLTRVIEPLNFLLNLGWDKFLDRAWENLLKNQAHDSICGCSTDKVHAQVDIRFQKVDDILNYLEKKLSLEIQDDNGKAQENICVYNLSNYKTSGIVKFTSDKIAPNAQVLREFWGFPDKKFYDIYSAPVTEDYTKLYEQVVQIEPQEPFSFAILETKKPEIEHNILENSIENKFIKVIFSQNKICVVDKTTGKKYEDFIKIIDIKDDGDSYNYAPLGQKEISPLGCEILVKGEILSTLRIKYENINFDILANNKTKFLEFNVEIDNVEKNHKIQVMFNLDEPIYQTFAQDSKGIKKREHDPNYSLLENVPTKERIELKTNLRPMQSFVFAQNFGVITQGLHEYEIYKNGLYVTLLRSVGKISNPKNPARGVSAGPPLDVPDLQCLGKNFAKFGICFVDEPQELFEQSDEFLDTKIAFLTNKNQQKEILLNLSQNHYFMGILDKNFQTEGIYYTPKTDELEFLPLAKHGKI